MEEGNGRVKELLKIGFESIAAHERKAVRAVQEQCGERLHYNVHTIGYWCRGFLSRPDQVESLVRYMIAKVRMVNWYHWANSLLIQTHYPHREALLQELFPECTPPGEPVPVRSNLPPSFGDFVGRAEELHRVLQALDSARWPVVAIEGLGGLGKTTLALQAARRCLPGPQGALQQPFTAVIWISAKDQPEKKLWFNDILTLVARELGYDAIAQHVSAQKRAIVNQLLAQQRTLLVIDNFETIDDRELDGWLEEVPEPSKVLITSRYAKLRAAKAIYLQGLKAADALAFIHRHERDLGLGALLASDETGLHALVQATEGNPKAMEMTLGHVRDGGLRIEEVVEHLYTMSRTVGDIFQYLFARAWQALTVDASHLLQVMPFFVDTASKEALGVAADLSGYQLETALEQLERMSLLERRIDDKMTVRYGIHPLTRAFARSKLAEAALWEQQARQRWSKYYLRFAEGKIERDRTKGRYWDALGGGGRLAALDPEWPNFQQVLAWADVTKEDHLLVELMVLLVHFLNRRGYYTERLAFATKAALAAHRLGQSVDEALLRIDAIGHIHIEKGDLEAAKEEVRRGLQLTQGLDNTQQAVKDVQALAHAFLVRIYLQHIEQARQQGNGVAILRWIASANAEIERGLRLECRPVIRLCVLLAGGELAHKQQAYAAAVERYQAAIALPQHAAGSDRAEYKQLYHRLGFVYLDSYYAGQNPVDLACATEWFRKALPADNEPVAQVGEAGEEACAQFGLARIALITGELEKAYALAQAAHEQLARHRAGHRLLEELTRFLDDLQQVQHLVIK